MDTAKQTTLGGSFSLFGKGLHTGLSLTVTFNPAPENTGYKIQRIDLEDQPIIDAIADNVIETKRGTVLQQGEARVSTVEHGMSALYALGIDNCLIQVCTLKRLKASELLSRTLPKIIILFERKLK